MAEQIYYSPFIPTFNSNGAPFAGAQLVFYYTGTTTKAPIWADAGLSVPLENPVPSNAAAKYPTIYLDDTITYRVGTLTPNGALVGDYADPYLPAQPGPAGPAGPADNTYTSLANFKAQDITNKAARMVGAPGVTDGSFNWTLGDFTGLSDDINIIKADSTDLSVGAWVRQQVDGLIYLPRPGEVGAINLQYEVGDSRRYGVFPDGTTDWEGTTNYLDNMLQTGMAGYKLFFRKDGDDYFYNTSWNTTNLYGQSDLTIHFEEGTEFAGILHLITSANPIDRIEPSAVTTGTTTTITTASPHPIAVDGDRYVTFTNTGCAALDGQVLLTSRTSDTTFTVPADTTGQTWNGAGYFNDAPLTNVTITGTYTTYDRFGTIWVDGCYVERVVCKSDASKNNRGEEGRGVHVYFGCANWRIGEMIVENLGPQSENPTNHAAIAFDGDRIPPQNISIGKLWVKDSNASGVILTGQIDVGEIVVDACGRSNTTQAPENVAGTDPLGNNATAVSAAVWLVRHTGRIGAIRINQIYGFGTSGTNGGRAPAVYGVVAEGTYLNWTSATQFTYTRQGASIGYIQSKGVKGSVLAVGPFGEAGSVQVDRIDLGTIPDNADMVIDGGIRQDSGLVWTVTGELSFRLIVGENIRQAHALRGHASADVIVNGDTVTIAEHQVRAIWLRCNGSINAINLPNRTSAGTAPSVQVDSAFAQLVTINSIYGRSVAGVDAPFLTFAPNSGAIGMIDVLDYAPTDSNVAAVRLGNGGSQRINLRGGQIAKSGTDAGTGLIIDGTQDSRVDQVFVSGFSLGVDDDNTNTRLTCVGNVATGNTVDTALPAAQLTAASAANVNWSV